jgi:ABC-type bacteriocin/lantibiotic exporter with double-glycine peptidase domain
MPKPLLIPYHAQISAGYCLAACAQMALDYLGLAHSQEYLADLLEVVRFVGAPARNIRLLASLEVAVVFEKGTVDSLSDWHSQGAPVIAFVQAGELPYWRGEQFQHAVVVTNIDGEYLWLLDPDYGPTQVAVPIEEFMLAWDELDNLYAILTKTEQ